MFCGRIRIPAKRDTLARRTLIAPQVPQVRDLGPAGWAVPPWPLGRLQSGCGRGRGYLTSRCRPQVGVPRGCLLTVGGRRRCFTARTSA